MTAPTQDDKNPDTRNQTAAEPQNNDFLEGYEQLKRQNRSRLIGAGALSLMALGIFAAIVGSSNTDSNPPELAGSAAVQASAPRTDSISPTAGRQPENHLADNTASEIPDPLPDTPDSGNDVGLPPEESVVQPDRIQKITDAVPPAYNHNADRANPADMQRRLNAVNGGAALPPPVSTETPAQKKKRERAEKEAKAREAEAKRIAAQNAADRAEAEREAKKKAEAERVRQAQLSDEGIRKAERDRLRGQKKTAAEESKQQAKSTADKMREDSTRAQPATPAAGGKEKRAWVQAGAFRDRALADRAAQQLKSMSYGAVVEEISTAKGKMYRVRTGTLPNRTAAQQAAQKIQSKGLGGVVIEQK